MAMSETATVFLIDCHIYIFRAYFALPEMRAPDGSPTNAAYGFTNSLIRFWSDSQPTHVAACFDHSTISFRNAIEPEYKAQRGEPDEDLELQFDVCKQAAAALGFPVFEARDFEADDVIATFTRSLREQGANVVVMTTDKDLAQLVREDDSVVLGDLASDDLLDFAGVCEKFGVEPSQIPDYLGLVGDVVDNLPGVPGVGRKTAAAALRAFDAIEGIPADPEAWAGTGVRGARRAAGLIEQHRERALRTKELATLRSDVPGLACAPGALRLRGADREGVDALFGRLGWDRIASRIPRWCGRSPRRNSAPKLSQSRQNRG
jgi:DNA polymerase-1